MKAHFSEVENFADFPSLFSEQRGSSETYPSAEESGLLA